MAVPHADYYACASGGVIAGGRFVDSVAWAFTEGVATEFSLDQAFPDIDGSAVAISLTSGTLPAGVTLDPLGKKLFYDGTAGAQAGVVDLVASPVAPSLTITGSGSLPVLAGIAFPKGVVTGNIGTSVSGLFVTVLRTWNDGSVKHAAVSGVAPGGSRVTFNQQPQGGTLLTHADILAANPSATMDLGVNGSASLQSLLLAGPTRTWISTPGMVECSYRTQLAVATLFVEFHVRLFSNGALFVRAVVENSHRLTTSGTNFSLTGTVVIDNVTVYTYSAGNLYKNTLHVHERWVGTTQYTHLVKNDVAQLQRTKLVPNYGMVSCVAESSLASLPTAYAIGSRLLFTQTMGDTGYQQQIGILPNWEAKYLVSNDDRALRSVLAHGKAIFNYPVVWREGNRMILPTDYPTSNMFGVGAGGTYECAAGTLVWEAAHHPSAGYLAYLISADPIYLDALTGQSALIFQIISTNLGAGTNRRFYGGQTRWTAWCKRSIGQTAAILPDSHVGKATMQEWVAKNMTFFAGISLNDPAAADSLLGYPSAVSTYNEAAGQSVAPWMHHFWIGSMGHLSDIEATTSLDMSVLNSLRDWMYRGIVGILGDGNSFCYTMAASYSLIISAEVVPNYTVRNAAQLYQNWADVWNANYPGVGCTNTIGTPSAAARGYWGNLLPAISMAVDHGASGALTSWNRIKNSTNWAAFAGAEFYLDPVWAVAPREPLETRLKHLSVTVEQPANTLPAWRQAMANNTIIQVSSNALYNLNPRNNPLINPNYPDVPEWYGSSGIDGLVNPWCGACWDEEEECFWLPLQGGHQDYGGNEPYKLDLSVDSPVWTLERWPSGAVGNLLTTNDGKELTGVYADGRPRATHSTNKFAMVPGMGIVLGSMGNCWFSGSAGKPATWLLNRNTAEWTYKALHPSPGQTGSGGICYDSFRHRIWYKCDAEGYVSYLDLNTWTWTVLSAFQYDTSWNNKQLHYLPEHDLIFQIDAAKAGGFCLWSPANGVKYSPGVTGSPPTGLSFTMGGAWDGTRMLGWNHSSNTQTIGALTPTGNLLTEPWAWSTLTFTGVTPTVRVPNGTYSRFAYSKKLQGCILQNGVTVKTYFFSLDD